MARTSEVYSSGISRVVWLEVEEDEVEFLYVPGLKFYWPKPLPLLEGDQFLRFILDVDVCFLPEVFFQGDVNALDKLYRMWRESQGFVDPDELMETVNELQAQVRELLKAVGIEIHRSTDVELELELQELRAEKGVT